jgi:CRISPR/Cas system-associated endonuclease Cas1
VFKPIIVFKTIFELVNNRRIQVKKHFEKSVNYCLLNDEGRKIFIEAFEKRMDTMNTAMEDNGYFILPGGTQGDLSYGN